MIDFHYFKISTNLKNFLDSWKNIFIFTGSFVDLETNIPKMVETTLKSHLLLKSHVHANATSPTFSYLLLPKSLHFSKADIYVHPVTQCSIEIETYMPRWDRLLPMGGDHVFLLETRAHVALTKKNNSTVLLDGEGLSVQGFDVAPPIGGGACWGHIVSPFEQGWHGSVWTTFYIIQNH